MSRNIYVENYESGILVDATTVVLADPTGTYGIKKNSDDTIIVEANTVTTAEATGLYTYDIDSLDTDLAYTAYFKITRASGDIEYVLVAIDAITILTGTAYVTLDEISTYMSKRVIKEAWEDATPTEILTAALEATRIIDTLNFVGEKAVATQDSQFPRGTDTTVPDTIKYACIEIHYALLDGIDMEKENENLYVVKNEFDKVKTTYNRSTVVEHIAAGVPSSIAWRYLKPYLRDIRGVDLNRVS